MNNINQALQAYDQNQRFGVATVPFHDHNGINSPVVKTPVTSYTGFVNADGTIGINFPKGWTATLIGAGQYQIVHNLGLYNYAVSASCTGGTGATYNITNSSAIKGNAVDYANQFVIHWVVFSTGSGQLNTSVPFMFTLVVGTTSTNTP